VPTKPKSPQREFLGLVCTVMRSTFDKSQGDLQRGAKRRSRTAVGAAQKLYPFIQSTVPTKT